MKTGSIIYAPVLINRHYFLSIVAYISFIRLFAVNTFFFKYWTLLVLFMNNLIMIQNLFQTKLLTAPLLFDFCDIKFQAERKLKICKGHQSFSVKRGTMGGSGSTFLYITKVKPFFNIMKRSSFVDAWPDLLFSDKELSDKI